MCGLSAWGRGHGERSRRGRACGARARRRAGGGLAPEKGPGESQRSRCGVALRGVGSAPELVRERVRDGRLRRMAF